MLKISSAPKGAFTDNSKYQVFARETGGDWQELPCYLALTPNGGGNWHPLPEEHTGEFDGVVSEGRAYGTLGVKTWFARLDTTDKTEIKVIVKGGFNTLDVRPKNTLSYKTDKNEVYLTLSPLDKAVIEPDGDIFGSLQLFADPVYSSKAEGYSKVITFTSGLHTAENSPHICYNPHGIPVVSGITDNTLIVAESGAVIRAVLDVYNVKNVKIIGGGIFDTLYRCCGGDTAFSHPPVHGGFRYHALPSLYIHGDSRNIGAVGITLLCEFRGVTVRNSQNIDIDNVKIFTYSVNADGINGMNCRNFRASHTYIRSGDDNFALFNTCDSVLTLVDPPELSYPPVTENISLENSIIWCSCRVTCIGGHGTNSTDPHDLLQNVTVKNCTVIAMADSLHNKDHNHARYWRCVFRIICQSQQLIRNISISDITVEWTDNYIGRPFCILVRESKDASYTESGGYRIENVTFENIAFTDLTDDRLESELSAPDMADKTYAIEGVTFKNITLDGNPFTPADLTTSGNVFDVKIEKPLC